jgi:hypothetical protein
VLPARAGQKGDSQNKTARTRQPEQHSHKTGQLELGMKNGGGTDKTGMPTKGCGYSTARTRQSEQDSRDRTVRRGEPEGDSQNGMS